MDRAKTQTQVTKLMREFCLFLMLLRMIEDLIRKCNPSNAKDRVRIYGGSASVMSGWVLTGIRVGTAGVGAGSGNTSDKARLYPRITKDSPSGGTSTVNVYLATGASSGDKVMTGTVSNAGGTCTLSAANSSGASGTVVVGAVSASETVDTHYLELYPDLPARAADTFDGSEPDHETCRLAFLGGVSQFRDNLIASYTQVKRGLNVFMATRFKKFWGSASSSVFDAKPQTTNGLVSFLYQGVLEDARRNMGDNTPTAQTIVKAVVTAASPVFADADNDGRGAMVAPTMAEWAEPGSLLLECEVDTVGLESFKVSIVLDSDGSTVESSRRLQIKRPYQDADLGILDMLLTRTLALHSGSANDFKNVATVWTIDGESPTNTDDGDIFLEIVASGAKWIVNGYASSTLSAASQVFTTAATSAGATAVLVSTGVGGSISGTLVVGDAPTDGNPGTLRLNVFKRSNAKNLADRIDITVSRTSVGEIMRQLANLYGYKLNTATSGSETILDDYAKAGSFPAYSDDDLS